MFFHSLKNVLVAALVVGAAIPVRAGKDSESGVIPPGLVKEDHVGSKRVEEDDGFLPILLKELENDGVADRVAVPFKGGKSVKQEEARTPRITKAVKGSKSSKSDAPSSWPSTTPSAFPSAAPSDVL